MKISADGLAVLKHFEGCQLEAYPDPGSETGDPWTIGRGHTGPEVHKGLSWTQNIADLALLSDLVKFEDGVTGMVSVQLMPGQFDALVCFAFNCGLAALNTSTLLRKLNAGDYEGAAHEFARWNKNGGRVMRGLVRRRAAEEALFRGLTGKQAIATGMMAA